MGKRRGCQQKANMGNINLNTSPIGMCISVRKEIIMIKNLIYTTIYDKNPPENGGFVSCLDASQ